MADDNRPFVVESPSRIRLGPEAKWWARQHGMSYTDMARFLLAQHAESGQSYEEDIRNLPPGTEVHEVTPEEQATWFGEASVPATPEDLQRYGALTGDVSVNVEDRRQDPTFNQENIPDYWLDKLEDEAGATPQQLISGGSGMARNLGFEDIGQHVVPSAQVLGPTQPRYPAAFGKYLPSKWDNAPFE